MTLITFAELYADLPRAAAAVFDAYEDGVRSHPAMPRDTGALADGVQVTDRSFAEGRATGVVRSTARSDDGADYGSIINSARGGTIRPKRYKGGGDTGFGPRALSDGGDFGPVASARQSTAHVGWWGQVNSVAVWDAAVARLGAFGL